MVKMMRMVKKRMGMVEKRMRMESNILSWREVLSIIVMLIECGDALLK